MLFRLWVLSLLYSGGIAAAVATAESRIHVEESIVKRFMRCCVSVIASRTGYARQTPAYTRVYNEAVYGFVIVGKDGR